MPKRNPRTKKAYDLGANPLAGVNSKQPDKELYDKAMLAMKKGHFDVARLDLQTMLNTYPESEYRMRAKLAVGDSWFKEGGSAALTQAESEYHDFITFFPNAPEAAEAQMKVADIYYSQMEKPDRDFKNAQHAEREYRNMINQFPDSTLVPRAKQKLREVQEVWPSARPTSASITRPAKTTTPPSPACKPWWTPTRSIPRATRLSWASATPMPARHTPCRWPPSFPERSRSG
jgi:tetratricopeptide (TPR) repeat protein